MLFKDLKLPGYAQKAMEQLGFAEATEIQQKTIPMLFEGKDVVGKSQTGSGKTFAFAIPAVEKVDVDTNAVQVLVVCPTRELAIQVCGEIQKVAQFKNGCKVTPVYGGSNIDRQIVAIKKGTRIVVGTPGRIMDHINRRTLKLKNVSMVVLDEADEMLNMGFREDIEEILKNTNSDRQTVMFSATMPKPILEITKSYMKNPVHVSVESKISTALTIEQFYINVNRGRKHDVLLELFEKLKPQKTIIFCNTKRMVDELVSKLSQNNIFALGLHGDMRQNERKRVMEKIHNKLANVLIATDVAARGIDINDIDIIFNYDLPNDTDFYVHRIGRTGRAGKKGKAYTLLSNKSQKTQIESMKKELGINIVEYQLASTSVRGDRAADSPARERSDRKTDSSFRGRKEQGRDSFSGRSSENKFRGKNSGNKFNSKNSENKSYGGRSEDKEKKYDKESGRDKFPRFADKSDRKNTTDKKDSDRRFQKSFGNKDTSYPKTGRKEYSTDKKRDSVNGYGVDKERVQKPSYGDDKSSYKTTDSGRKFTNKKTAPYRDGREKFTDKTRRFSKDKVAGYDSKEKNGNISDRKSSMHDKKPRAYDKSSRTYDSDSRRQEGFDKKRRGAENSFSRRDSKNKRSDSAKGEKRPSAQPFGIFRKSSINKHKK